MASGQRNLPFPVIPSSEVAMPSVLFWNVQRLGEGSNNVKKDFILDVARHITGANELDYLVFCEITSSFESEDFDMVITKQAAVGKQSARAEAAQLGYACFRRDGKEFVEHPLELTTIADADELFESEHNPMKGGGSFGAHAKRYVVRIQGTDVYIFHNNASAIASGVLAWVVASLHCSTGGKFLLIGDMNCEPMEFVTKLDLWLKSWRPANNDLNTLTAIHSVPQGKTHNAKFKLEHMYDWAIHSGGIATTKTLDWTREIQNLYKSQSNIPDHLPIWVDFAVLNDAVPILAPAPMMRRR